jgi:hypothetical protein
MTRMPIYLALGVLLIACAPPLFPGHNDSATTAPVVSMDAARPPVALSGERAELAQAMYAIGRIDAQIESLQAQRDRLVRLVESITEKTAADPEPPAKLP